MLARPSLIPGRGMSRERGRKRSTQERARARAVSMAQRVNWRVVCLIPAPPLTKDGVHAAAAALKLDDDPGGEANEALAGL